MLGELSLCQLLLSFCLFLTRSPARLGLLFGSLAFSLALLTLLPFSIIVFFICIAVRVCTLGTLCSFLSPPILTPVRSCSKLSTFGGHLEQLRPQRVGEWVACVYPSIIDKEGYAYFAEMEQS